MSGGGSQTTASTPWGPTSPYLLDIMQQAQKQYQSQAPNYANPAGNFNYGNTTGAVGNAISGTTPFGSMASSISPNTTTAIQKQLSGVPDYTAVNGALKAADQQTWDSFNNQELPILNQNASFLGNPSGSIKDLNWATSQIGKNMDLNAQQAYLGEYDKSQAAQLSAAGLGANIAQGAGAQSLQGANLYSGLSQLPQTALGDYASIVSGTGGKFGTSTEQNKPGSGQTAANVIGGLTAGSGLVNSLFGTGGSGGGTVGAISNLFGGGGAAVNTGAIGSAAGETAAGLGSGASAGMANTAADVAASNSAWLGGSASAGGLGAGAGAAAASEPALAAVGTGAVDAAADSAAASAAGALGSGAGAGSGGAAGTGAIGGSMGGLAAGVGIAALPLIAGLMTKGVALNQQYFTNISNNLTSSDPKVRLPAIDEALANPDVLQHVQIDNPALYQQLISGQAMRDALNAYSASQAGRGGGIAATRGVSRA